MNAHLPVTVDTDGGLRDVASLSNEEIRCVAAYVFGPRDRAVIAGDVTALRGRVRQFVIERAGTVYLGPSALGDGAS